MDRFSPRLATALLADRHAAARIERRALEASDSMARSRSRPNRVRVVAVVGAVALAAMTATAAAAAPVERTRSTVDCAGHPVTLVMHPGSAAPVQWDISVETVDNAPSFIAKYIEADIYIDGQYASSFTTSLGQMVGLGEPLACSFEVHKPGFDAYGYTELVLLR